MTTLKCSQYSNGRCSRPANWVSARAVDGWKDYGKTALTFPKPQQVLSDFLYCNVHRGAAARSAAKPWGQPVPMYALDAVEAKEVVAGAMAEQRVRDEANAKERAFNHAKAQAANERQNEALWGALDKVPTLVKVNDDEDSDYRKVVTYAVTFAPESPRDWDRRNFEVIVRTIRDSDDWDDIAPVVIRTNTSREYTPAEARVAAEALLIAARAAEAINVERAEVRRARRR